MRCVDEPLVGGASSLWGLTVRRPRGRGSRARAANQFRSAKIAGQLAARAVSTGTLGPVRAGGTRRVQRIRWRSRSTSGSMPKLVCSDVAHRSRRGFPSRSCAKSANTASCVWHFTPGARRPKYRMLWRCSRPPGSADLGPVSTPRCCAHRRHRRAGQPDCVLATVKAHGDKHGIDRRLTPKMLLSTNCPNFRDLK